ncbi:MurR/RpiR family transcriptional regulator [Chakrabartyella piscis]|uniref:MurR/RpiR family transcriptional regulator n=1 Tax=Chakrabartyella piscis TaxID=2918914 RepID=UPI002958D9BA|nr:MurR/RpiR family transcriptional regulator [Chakrabartyella piscis]
MTLQEKIKVANLTKTERTIADFVLGNFRSCCYMTSTTLAESSGASHSSVLRLVKDLDFSGYSDFQNFIRDEYNSYLDDKNDTHTMPAVKLASSMSELSKSSIIETVSASVQSNIQSVIAKNSHQTFDAATDAIIRSKVKYIIGSRSCASITAFLTVILKDTLPLVFAKPHVGGNTFDFLSDITSKDCLIVTSHARYSKLSLLSAEMAYHAGATIIVLTDTPTAPIAKYATFLFTNDAKTLTFFNSHVATLFTAEILATYICKKVGMKNKEKLELINHYTTQMELY